MGPVKFDDLAKVATEVLDDDYKTSGYEFKAKQKTSWEGAVVTTAVDVLPKDGKSATPAKVTWKMPALLGVSGLHVDKLEMDKSGKFKLEASADKALHNVPNLKLELKSDLSGLSKVAVGATYTAIKDVQLKLETKPLKPEDLSFEATGTVGGATCGVKCAKPTDLLAPDLGARFETGPFFGALKTSKIMKPDGKYTAFGMYKLTGDVKAAASLSGASLKLPTEFCAGLAYSPCKGTCFKVKGFHKMGSANSQALVTSVKFDLAKGFTVIGGGKLSVKGVECFGCSLSIE